MICPDCVRDRPYPSEVWSEGREQCNNCRWGGIRVGDPYNRKGSKYTVFEEARLMEEGFKRKGQKFHRPETVRWV